MINKITSDSPCKLFDARWKNCRVKSPYEQKFEKKKPYTRKAVNMF